jgi:hypothetical protein
VFVIEEQCCVTGKMPGAHISIPAMYGSRFGRPGFFAFVTAWKF